MTDQPVDALEDAPRHAVDATPGAVTPGGSALQAERDLARAARDLAEAARDGAEAARRLAEVNGHETHEKLEALEEQVAFLSEVAQGSRSYREHVVRAALQEIRAELNTATAEIERLRLVLRDRGREPASQPARQPAPAFRHPDSRAGMRA